MTSEQHLQPSHAQADAGARLTGTSVPSNRIATIDWMRGLVMLLMVIDHASMAFDKSHLSKDSALFPEADTMALPGAEFFTRWITHICAPTFVFLAGTSLALSVERRVAKGASASEIDRNMLKRGAIIALLDPTIVSLGSRRLTFGVLFAIGMSMICMAGLRRLSSSVLCAVAVGWMVLGEWVTRTVWTPPGNSSVLAALGFAGYRGSDLAIIYPVIPWLAIMVLGWAFGRHLLRFSAGGSRVSGVALLWIAGGVGLLTYFAARYNAGYGDMFLHRNDNSWQQWLHVSKYPPSLTFYALELGMLCSCLAALRWLELRIGVRRNGVLLVFGETAMFFYLVHRLVLEVPAAWFGLRGVGDLTTTYVVAAILCAALYPACLWYRGFKKAHPDTLLKYF